MSKATLFKFRLYIAADGPNSLLAIVNLKSFCEDHLKARYKIEQICVVRDPKRAMADHVLLTPMVVRIAPVPEVRIVGNLSEKQPLLRLLERGARTR